jgi:GT2 family glycosyltransferase/glycosyltransferase involved in cell wall biosynthesis
VILFVSYSGLLGGAERLLIGWALALEDERCIACPEGALAEAARAAGLRVFELRERSLELRGSPRDRVLAGVRLAAHHRELRKLVESLRPDIVVLCGIRSAIAGAALRRPVAGAALRRPVAGAALRRPVAGAALRRPVAGPAVVFQQSDLLPGPVIGWLVRRAALRSDLVLALSGAVAADLDPARALGERLQVVHPGIETERFDAGAPPDEPPEVLVLGAIAPSKRPDLALEAFALARRVHPELQLRLAGEPLTDSDRQLADALRARAAQPDLAGSVELLGAVADPARELERAACLLHLAPREAFGMAVLEALAAGRPAVVPDSGGPPEIVDESCGILYPPGDVVAAADALVRLASEPGLAARMGAAGRERAREHFSLQSARRQWAAAVERVRPVAGASPRASRGPAAGGLRGPAAGGLRVPAAAGSPREPSAGSSRPVEVVTVTHNSAAVLGELLASVERHLPGTPVIVVDSGSSDDTLGVARRFGSARVIALERNVGFGTASNVGVREASAPVVALLNPDVELLDASLLELVEELSRHGAPDRLLAPLALNSDGSRQDTVHPEPGSWAEMLMALVSPGALPGAAATALAPWRSRAPRRVGWAVGCALAARTETLRRLGPFDERLFMYGEDLDLCLRARREGVETWFWPAARVIHHRAHASGAAFGGEPFELLARARHEVVRRRIGRARGAGDDAAQALTFATRIAVKGLLGRSTARERRQLKALLAARRRDG